MSSAPLQIAVVDDEEAVRKALHRLLRSAGFVVETFASGDDFLKSLSQHLPDCLVLDLHMPSISGFDVQQQLRSSHLSVPTVVITGNDSPDSWERAMFGGAREYLRKPVDAPLLLEAIHRAVYDQPLRRES